MTGGSNGAADGHGAPGLARDCGELSTAVAIARQSIAQGGHADLEPLVERLAALLDGLEAVGRPERRDLLPQLVGLAEEIEELGVTIDAECRRCREALAKGEVSARVVAAYTKNRVN